LLLQLHLVIGLQNRLHVEILMQPLD